MLLLLTLLAATPSHAARFDIIRCNGLAGRAGVGSTPSIKDHPYYRIDENGKLEFAHSPRTVLVSSSHGKNEDDLSYYEFHAKNDDTLTFGEGIGEQGVLKVTLKLHREKGAPALLETTSTWFALASGETWEKRKKTLKGNPPKRNERTHDTETWVRYGISGDRCYVSQEGGSVRGRTVVTFDQLLCNRILHLTDRDPVDLLHDYREGTTIQKNEANRVLRLLRDEQVARDEKLKGENKRLLAVDSPPEHQLPGTLPPEDSNALQELRVCIAALARNGLKRPEALSKENFDFMGNEPQPDVDEPSAAGTNGGALPPPAP